MSVPGEARIPARTDAAVAVLSAPKRRIELMRLLPSGRASAITLAVVALAAGVYLVARETSVFAVDTIDVRGAPPSIAGEVRAALADFKGGSLVTLNGAAVVRRLDGLPVVASARYDRDFPHTLRVFIEPEHPVAVVRRGPDSWLVSARGRVISNLGQGDQSALPRIWVKGSVSVSPGGMLSGDPARAARAAAPLARSPLRGRVTTVRVTPDEVALVLRSGLQLELGNTKNLPLKLMVGAQIAHSTQRATGYVDLTVPDRPVSKLNSQPEG